jgi:hypothetical protein
VHRTAAPGNVAERFARDRVTAACFQPEAAVIGRITTASEAPAILQEALWLPDLQFP